MEKQILNANELEYKTFSFLKVNSTKIDIDGELSKREKIARPKNLDGKNYGISEEILKIHDEYTDDYKKFETENGETKDFGIVKKFSDKTGIETVDIIAKQDSKLKLYLNYDYKKEGFRSSLIRILAEENSNIDLYISNFDEKPIKSLASIVFDLKENANLNLYLYQVGDSDVYQNLHGFMDGKNSTGNIKGIYIGRNSQHYDFLYNMAHEGKKSNSDLNVQGALLDHAKKTFKSSLDFKKGSSGSIGNEEEYAILLDETPTNISVPALLSHEDDVEGNHAASSGTVDKDMIFYIMSRGFSESDAYKLIVDARFAPIIDMIEKEELKERIWKELYFITEGRNNA